MTRSSSTSILIVLSSAIVPPLNVYVAMAFPYLFSTYTAHRAYPVSGVAVRVINLPFPYLPALSGTDGDVIAALPCPVEFIVTLRSSLALNSYVKL